MSTQLGLWGKLTPMRKNDGLWLFALALSLIYPCSLRATSYTVTASQNWTAFLPQPSSGDDITVISGATLTVNTNNATCVSIQLGGGSGGSAGTGTLLFNANSQLTCVNSMVLGPSKNGFINMTSGGTLKLGAFLTINTGSSITPGTGTIEYNKAGDQTVSLATYNTLVLSGSGTKSLPAAALIV